MEWCIVWMILESEHIKNFQEWQKNYYGFTFRQWLFLVLTGIITVPTYLYLTPILGDEISSWIVIIMGLPLMLCGFLTLQGMTADRLLPFLKTTTIWIFGKPFRV